MAAACLREGRKPGNPRGRRSTEDDEGHRKKTTPAKQSKQRERSARASHTHTLWAGVETHTPSTCDGIVDCVDQKHSCVLSRAACSCTQQINSDFVELRKQRCNPATTAEKFKTYRNAKGNTFDPGVSSTRRCGRRPGHDGNRSRRCGHRNEVREEADKIRDGAFDRSQN